MKVIYTRKGRKKGRITPAIERERNKGEEGREEKKKKKSARGGGQQRQGLRRISKGTRSGREGGTRRRTTPDSRMSIWSGGVIMRG